MPVLSLPASKNVFVSEHYPDRNYSIADNDVLFLGRFMNIGDSFRSFLQFDLKQLTKKYSANIEIESAYLQIFMYRNEIKSGTIEINIYRLLDPWNQQFLTWNNQVAFHNIPEQTFIIPSEWEGLMFIELSSLVKKWFKGAIPNYGIILKGDEDKNCLSGIRSTNYRDPDTHPQLKILYKASDKISY